jgi:hypothetical protein
MQNHELRLGWLNTEQKLQASRLFKDAHVSDKYWYVINDKGQVTGRNNVSNTKCSYPKCNCPFDAPSDPNWCARGFSK